MTDSDGWINMRFHLEPLGAQTFQNTLLILLLLLLPQR